MGETHDTDATESYGESARVLVEALVGLVPWPDGACSAFEGAERLARIAGSATGSIWLDPPVPLQWGTRRLELTEVVAVRARGGSPPRFYTVLLRAHGGAARNLVAVKLAVDSVSTATKVASAPGGYAIVSERRALEGLAGVPGVPRVQFAGVEPVLPPGVSAFVRSWVEGDALHVALRPGEATPSDIVAFGRALFDAIDAIHARGWVHCDVKPSNLVVRRDERSGSWEVCLIDFELAQQLEPDGTFTMLDPARGRHVVWPGGTPPYLAPEMHRLISRLRNCPDGERAWEELLANAPELSSAVDLYAAGVVLLELLFGPLETKQAEGVERALRDLRASKNVRAALADLLYPQSGGPPRPGSDATASVKRRREHGKEEWSKLGDPSRRRRRVWAWGLAALAGAVLAGGLLVAQGTSGVHADPPTPARVSSARALGRGGGQSGAEDGSGAPQTATDPDEYVVVEGHRVRRATLLLAFDAGVPFDLSDLVGAPFEGLFGKRAVRATDAGALPGDVRLALQAARDVLGPLDEAVVWTGLENKVALDPWVVERIRVFVAASPRGVVVAGAVPRGAPRREVPILAEPPNNELPSPENSAPLRPDPEQAVLTTLFYDPLGFVNPLGLLSERAGTLSGGRVEGVGHLWFVPVDAALPAEAFALMGHTDAHPALGCLGGLVQRVACEEAARLRASRRPGWRPCGRSGGASGIASTYACSCQLGEWGWRVFVGGSEAVQWAVASTGLSWLPSNASGEATFDRTFLELPWRATEQALDELLSPWRGYVPSAPTRFRWVRHSPADRQRMAEPVAVRRDVTVYHPVVSMVFAPVCMTDNGNECVVASANHPIWGRQGSWGATHVLVAGAHVGAVFEPIILDSTVSQVRLGAAIRWSTAIAGGWWMTWSDTPLVVRGFGWSLWQGETPVREPGANRHHIEGEYGKPLDPKRWILGWLEADGGTRWRQVLGGNVPPLRGTLPPGWSDGRPVGLGAHCEGHCCSDQAPAAQRVLVAESFEQGRLPRTWTTRGDVHVERVPPEVVHERCVDETCTRVRRLPAVPPPGPRAACGRGMAVLEGPSARIEVPLDLPPARTAHVELWVRVSGWVEREVAALRIAIERAGGQPASALRFVEGIDQFVEAGGADHPPWFPLRWYRVEAVVAPDGRVAWTYDGHAMGGPRAGRTARATDSAVAAGPSVPTPPPPAADPDGESEAPSPGAATPASRLVFEARAEGVRVDIDALRVTLQAP